MSTDAIVPRVWLALSIAAALLTAVSSAAGIWMPEVYARETISWAAQGIGQDIVNLFVVAPAIVVCVYLAERGSVRAWLVCLGLLLYITYSFVLYSFFVHFNRLFLVYVSVLGLSFWALVGAVSSADTDRVARALDLERGHATAAAMYLMVSGLLFGLLWLSDIVPAIASGSTPRGLADVGLPVNPVHVLDLAFALPATIATAWLLWRRRPRGLLFAVPLLTFTATMGVAIVGMSVVMNVRGLAAGNGVVAVFVVLVAIALDLTYLLLRKPLDVSIDARLRSAL